MNRPRPRAVPASNEPPKTELRLAHVQPPSITNARDLAWLADRLDLDRLPDNQRRWFDQLADEIATALVEDTEIHEGCVPASEHELENCDSGMIVAATIDGYEAACDDIAKRIRAIEPSGAPPSELRDRILAGVEKLKERGPKE